MTTPQEKQRINTLLTNISYFNRRLTRAAIKEEDIRFYPVPKNLTFCPHDHIRILYDLNTTRITDLFTSIASIKQFSLYRLLQIVKSKGEGYYNRLDFYMSYGDAGTWYLMDGLVDKFRDYTNYHAFNWAYFFPLQYITDLVELYEIINRILLRELQTTRKSNKQSMIAAAEYNINNRLPKYQRVLQNMQSKSFSKGVIGGFKALRENIKQDSKLGFQTLLSNYGIKYLSKVAQNAYQTTR